MRDFVANGSGAENDVNDAINSLYVSIDKLKGARAYAGQQLNALLAMRDQFELILNDHFNADLINAQGKVTQAIEDVQGFLNRVEYQINNIEKAAKIIRMHLEPLIGTPTNVTLEEVHHIIDEWARYL